MSQTAFDTQPYHYNQAAVSILLQQILQQNAAWPWLHEKAQSINTPQSNALAVAFAATPRKMGKQLLHIDERQQQQLQALRKNFTIAHWTTDRLARVWLLLQLDATDKEIYIKRIEQLFPAAEMNELVALYSALPLLAYPESWQHRCTEGIRSNIGPVLEAVICNNPYPSEQLPEGAWNQLVMKAFFTEKRVDQIVGFDERANAELAQILLDFAQERWAAGRPAPPLLWRGVAPFINEHNFTNIERAFYGEESIDRDAAALALSQTAYEPAKALLQKRPEAAKEIESGALTWNLLADKAAVQP